MANTIIYDMSRITPLYEAEEALVVNVNIPANTTLAAGTVLGEVTATPGIFKAYATGNVDGSGVARAICMYDVKSDANGVVSIGETAGGEFGNTQKCVPVYVSGIFNVADLTGLDADAVTDLKAVLISGDTTAGIIRIG